MSRLYSGGVQLNINSVYDTKLYNVIGETCDCFITISDKKAKHETKIDYRRLTNRCNTLNTF